MKRALDNPPISNTVKCAALLGGLAAMLLSPSASAITRTQALVRAKAYAYHPWTATASNKKASCKAAYTSVYAPGDYMGLPYDWGGYMTLFDFDQQISKGYGAGSYPEDGVLSCTSGVDCSGYVSKVWDAGHYATATVHKTSSSIAKASMKTGDIFNQAGFHMAMYHYTLNSGEPVMYESVGYNVHLSMPGWSWVKGYTPRRYSKITGEVAATAVGTPNNPIVVKSFPFTDQRNTLQSNSDVIDGCSVAPGKKETGAEYVYAVTLTKPGTLKVAVQDDVGVDIDVHIYASKSTSHCVARDDKSLSQQLDCGTYFVVADTFKGAKEYPGAYTLNIDFVPSNGSCGAGPPKFNFKGKLGKPCAYPGNKSLPFCNPNLDATTCLYTSNDSFCSKPCSGNGDCSAIPGGCCGKVGGGELYCLTPALCQNGGQGGGPSSEDPPDPKGDPNSGGGGTSSSTSSGVGGAPTTTSGVGAGNGSQHNPDDDDGATTTSSCTASPRPLGSGHGWATLLFGLAWLARRRD